MDLRTKLLIGLVLTMVGIYAYFGVKSIERINSIKYNELFKHIR